MEGVSKIGSRLAGAAFVGSLFRRISHGDTVTEL